MNNHSRNIRLLLFAVIFSLVLMALQFIIGGEEAFPRRFAAVVTKPLDGVMNASGSGIHDFFETISHISTLKKENEALKESAIQMKAELEQVKAFREENVELRQLLDLRKEWKDGGIPAEITGRDATNWFDRCEINKGKKDGIAKNMMVIVPEGLAGQVTAVFEGSATIRTILNPRSAVPVYVVESGAFGVLYGDGSEYCTVKYIRNITFTGEGNLVMTSGLGDIYPEGVLVGKTTKVQGSVDGLSNFAKVKPFVNTDSIRQVLVVRGKS
ncbi:MAG: rod shape-determining protein MreC [Candidatus Eremiobacteraeota bacterium]|nr:rod shape-determining protein MreC [Candidatus Eremiobacteraeota bacterium]